MRLIDADELKEGLKDLKAEGYNQKYVQGLQDAIDDYFSQIIDDAPTANVQPVKQDTELSSILQDYGIKDTDTLRYILDQYQKIIVDITGGQMSYLTYPAETVIACADDNYYKCYEESMNHGRWTWASNAPHREYGAYKCSNCGCYSDFEENYCPNCGCKQDLRGDSE